MTVAAIIVTRGDQDLWPVISSLPDEWEIIVWDNGAREVQLHHPQFHHMRTCLPAPDLSVYGRYAAIERTDAELIYVQDDDCIVSDPQALVRRWYASGVERSGKARRAEDYDAMTLDHSNHVVCNMPPEFRHEFYEEHALVGFGAVFHRDAPARAFDKLQEHFDGFPFLMHHAAAAAEFHRTCDIVFTGLTPRVLVDVPVESLPYAHHETRMWKQAGHQAERVRMLDLVRQIA